MEMLYFSNWCLRSCMHNCFNGVSFNESGISTRASQKERSAKGVRYRWLFAPAGVPPAFFLIPAPPGATVQCKACFVGRDMGLLPRCV